MIFLLIPELVQTLKYLFIKKISWTVSALVFADIFSRKLSILHKNHQHIELLKYKVQKRHNLDSKYLSKLIDLKKFFIESENVVIKKLDYLACSDLNVNSKILWSSTYLDHINHLNELQFYYGYAHFKGLDLISICLTCS